MKFVGLISGLVSSVPALHSSPAEHFLQTDTVQAHDKGAGPSCATLRNQGTHFTLNVEVGTPMDDAGVQHFDLVADTGSDSVIVRSCTCKNCKYPSNTAKEDRVCFQGTNHSSTFNLLESHGKMSVMQITFGSGVVQAVVATDAVKLGNFSTVMDGGLLLMISEKLTLPMSLEGIFGLGPPKAGLVPQEAEQSVQQSDSHLGGKKQAMEDFLRGLMNGKNPAMGGRDPFAGAGLDGTAGTQPVAAIEEDDVGHVQQVSWMEQAQVSRFSMCFGGDDQGNGRLTLNSAERAKKLPSVGKAHWGLPLVGISVAEAKTSLDGITYVNATSAGNASAPLCSDKADEKGSLMNCAAIPDSGTTLFTAGKQHVEALLETVCSKWERCQSNLTALYKAKDAALKVSEKMTGLSDPFGMKPAEMPPSLVMKLLLADCDRWLPEGNAEAEAMLNKEMPAVQFHLQGSQNEMQLIQLKPWHYVIETVPKSHNDSTVVDQKVMSLLQGATPKRVCTPAFGEMEYTTKENGPVWIMGTPLFYAYEVGYELKPATMSFTEGACQACSQAEQRDGHSLVSQGSTVSQREAMGTRGLRRIHGAPRVPRVDPSKPL